MIFYSAFKNQCGKSKTMINFHWFCVGVIFYATMFRYQNNLSKNTLKAHSRVDETCPSWSMVRRIIADQHRFLFDDPILGPGKTWGMPLCLWSGAPQEALGWVFASQEMLTKLTRSTRDHYCRCIR